MKHARWLALVAGVVVASPPGVAAAKSELTLNAEHLVARAGETVRFTGSAGDDAGIRNARYCVRVQAGQGHWLPVGPCASPYRAGAWRADFRTNIRFPAPGVFALRAVGVDARDHREIYGPSPAVTVTVRQPST